MIERKRLKRQRSNGIAMSSAGRGPDRPLIDSILLAAGAVGDPRKGGTGGVIGYLKWLASADPRTYATLLGRVLPLQRIVEDNTGNDNSKGTEEFFILLIALADRLAEDHVPQSPAGGLRARPTNVHPRKSSTRSTGVPLRKNNSEGGTA